MQERVGIIGVGYEGFRPAITDISTRELMFEASAKAYADAEVDPRKDVGSFICCTEDLWEGWSITDEMVPDQVGGARRPVCTVPGDGIIGMGHAVMHIRAGVTDVVAVEAHSKSADVLDKVAVENLALEPVFQRTSGANSDVLAGLEMSAYMHRAGVSRDELSEAVAAEKRRALKNARASYGASLSARKVSESEPVADPLRRLDRSEYAEGGIVVVLASEGWIRKNRREAVYVDGLAWRSSTPWFEGGDVVQARYAADCFGSASAQSKSEGLIGFDVVESDDTYSYKLFQHLMSLGMGKDQVLSAVKQGSVNPSGGSLGVGYLLEATGSHKVLECVLQIRGEAGGNQVKGVKKAMALSWRGNPTATGAAIQLSAGD